MVWSRTHASQVAESLSPPSVRRSDRQVAGAVQLPARCRLEPCCCFQAETDLTAASRQRRLSRSRVFMVTIHQEIAGPRNNSVKTRITSLRFYFPRSEICMRLCKWLETPFAARLSLFFPPETLPGANRRPRWCNFIKGGLKLPISILLSAKSERAEILKKNRNQKAAFNFASLKGFDSLTCKLAANS